MSRDFCSTTSNPPNHGKTTNPPSVRPMMVKIPAESESWKNSKGIVIKSYQEPGSRRLKDRGSTSFFVWKKNGRGKKTRAPKGSQRTGHKKKSNGRVVEVLSEETKNKLSQNWLLVKKLVTKRKFLLMGFGISLFCTGSFYPAVSLHEDRQLNENHQTSGTMEGITFFKDVNLPS